MRWRQKDIMIDNLYDKRTGKRVTIYAVGEDSNGYPKFLIREKNRWVWQSAKYYITEEEKYRFSIEIPLRIFYIPRFSICPRNRQ